MQAEHSHKARKYSIIYECYRCNNINYIQKYNNGELH